MTTVSIPDMTVLKVLVEASPQGPNIFPKPVGVGGYAKISIMTLAMLMEAAKSNEDAYIVGTDVYEAVWKAQRVLDDKAKEDPDYAAELEAERLAALTEAPPASMEIDQNDFRRAVSRSRMMTGD